MSLCSVYLISGALKVGPIDNALAPHTLAKKESHVGSGIVGVACDDLAAHIVFFPCCIVYMYAVHVIGNGAIFAVF